MGKNAERQKRQEEQAQIQTDWVFKNPYLQVRQDTIQYLEQTPETWVTAVLRGAVGILPIDAQGNIILVEQWRRAVDQITLEIPAGVIDPGEAPLTAAQRELQEEAGYRADELIPLGGYFPSPGMVSEYIHLFIGKKLIPSPLEANDTHKIDVIKVSLPQALRFIEEGKICDAKTTIAILRYSRD